MKNIYIFLIAAFVFFSCQKKQSTTNDSLDTLINNKDINGIKAKRETVLKSYDSVAAILGKIETALNDLNPDKKLPLVTVLKTQQTNFEHFVDLQGDVATKENIVIFPEFSGLLSKVYVKEGQHVKKGQILAKIDDGGLANQLAQVEVQANLAKTTYERQKRLWDQKIGSEIQFLQAKTNYEAQSNAVNQLKKQLDKTEVTAPFSGIIDDVISEQGQIVAPGQNQLFRIVNLSNMYVKADVPENYLPSIKKGASVKIALPSIGKNIKGKIRQVSNIINPNNRTFSIEISVPNKDQTIKPNLIANLEILDYHKENALLIPSDIIQENAQGEKFVYVVNPTKENEATVVKTLIQTGLSYKNNIEVVSGLLPNTTIVKDGAITLRDGLTVKISK
ncbi:efflux RND transporter periplasmic adaptor subunit [Tenacibaculum sp. UWU-22]|uniref:efflux RND transporter periplasmic adaptor subunit n=1 Tax=Tenacibaculum sp. UWU-22 TaxID=3234187 RepID=UPI0034DB2664